MLYKLRPEKLHYLTYFRRLSSCRLAFCTVLINLSLSLPSRSCSLNQLFQDFALSHALHMLCSHISTLLPGLGRQICGDVTSMGRAPPSLLTEQNMAECMCRCPHACPFVVHLLLQKGSPTGMVNDPIARRRYQSPSWPSVLTTFFAVQL